MSLDHSARFVRVARGLAPTAILIATLVAWAPIRLNYFWGDDFFHLYDLSTRSLLQLLGQTWGGHVLILYNASFWLAFQAFGVDPQGYYWLMLLTHLLNTALLYGVIRRFTASTWFGCFGALLWGTAPILAGTLGWFSVYGQALLTTIVLGVLWSLGKRLDRASPLTARTAASWAGLLALGSTAFGMGLAVAVVFPLVPVLVLGRGRAARASRIVLALGATATLVGYQLVLATAPPESGSGVAAIDTILRRLPAVLDFWMHLLVHGAAALVAGPFAPADPPIWLDWAGAATLAIVVVLGMLAAREPTRRRLLALVLLAGAAYAAVAAGRAPVYEDLRMPVSMATGSPRYHYFPLALLAVLACTALAALAARGLLATAAVAGGAALWTAGRLVMLLVRPLPIDHWDDQRLAVAALVRSILEQVSRTPPGEVVQIENRPFGASHLAHMPGWAGMFVVFFPENTVAGRPIRFAVSESEWSDAQKRGGRIAQLVVQR